MNTFGIQQVGVKWIGETNEGVILFFILVTTV